MPTYNFYRLDDGVDIGEGQPKPRQFGLFTPQLYLDILENPDKVKPELRGKPYACPAQSIDRAAETASAQQQKTQSESYLPDYVPDNEDFEMEPEEPQVQPLFSFGGGAARSRLQGLHRAHRVRPFALSSASQRSRSSRIYGKQLNPLERKQVAIDNLRAMSAQRSELSQAQPQVPKSLSELREAQAGQKNIEDQEKRELLAKINLFKLSYSESSLTQDFSMNTDIGYMRECYTTALKQVKISEKHLFFRKLLGAYYIGLEVFCGKVLKMDMKGFAEMQMKTIKSYDKYLLEICHKRYLPDAPESIAVEWRFFGALMIQTAGFILVSKLLGKNAAVMVQGLLSSLNIEDMLGMVQNLDPGKLMSGFTGGAKSFGGAAAQPEMQQAQTSQQAGDSFERPFRPAGPAGPEPIMTGPRKWIGSATQPAAAPITSAEAMIISTNNKRRHAADEESNPTTKRQRSDSEDEQDN